MSVSPKVRGAAKALYWGLLVLLAACGADNPAPVKDSSKKPPSGSYVVMDEDLAALKDDFNAAVDQVRLVFIVGPT